MRERTFVLDFSDAKELPDDLWKIIFDGTHNGIETYPLDAEVPGVWDTCPYIEGDNLIMEGGFGPSGYGSVRIKIPKKDAKENYQFSVWVNEEEIEAWEKSRKILEDCGVVLSKLEK